MKRRLSNKLIKGEKGQVLLVVMLMMLFGGIIIPPLLSHMQSGLKAGKEVFEERMYLSYAADSGVEDILWQVKNKQLPYLFPDYEDYGYYENNDLYEWKYDLEDQYGDNGMVNGKDVEIVFQNVWMPKGISAPSVSEAESIVVDGRLAVYGSMSGASATEFQIKLIYYYNSQDPGEPDYDPLGENLRIEKIGIWLPPGFEYNDSLAGYPDGFAPTLGDVPYKGGRAVVWSFPSSPDYPRLKDFDVVGSSTNPLVRAITFEFTGPEGRNPGTALSWVESTGVTGISYSWDSAVKLYSIASKATGEAGKELTVEAYAAMTDELRQGTAISGDYCALGSTLMIATGTGDDEKFRDLLYKDSSAEVQNTDPQAPFYIPPDAQVDLAYLYWSGWLENAGIWGDDCNGWDNWIQDNDWTIVSAGWWDYQFRGHHSSGTRDLAMGVNVNLSAYVGQTLQVSWSQSESGRLEGDDGLDFAFSADGGQTWSEPQNPPDGAFRDDNPQSTFTYIIPSQYVTSQFRMKFMLVGCSEGGGPGGSENVYIDDISISLAGGTPMENARVNQIMFNGYKVTPEPTDPYGSQTQQSGASGAPSSLSYACKVDVTDLVLQTRGSNGVGTYTVGHVLDWGGEYQLYNYPGGEPSGYTTAFPLGTPAKMEGDEYPTKYQWSYAAWSLVIVYSSPETQGHQLYLYEDFRYCDSNDTLNFTIGGFLAPEAIKDPSEHAAHLTCFVGEGDDHYPSDYIALNGDKLWDGTISTTNPPNNEDDPRNVWNSKSIGLAQSGIDIDTFTVVYPTITPDDVSADVEIDTATDSWNLIYMILSFRSEIVPASTVSYLVR